ncbi:MAG: hypothetical protein ACT4OW_02050 [Nitrososphaerota archaeon]
MSDIFIKMAQNELGESIKSLEAIIADCKSDSDVISNYKEIERHLHNIKGLAPMSGFEKMGQIADLAGEILIDVIKNNLKFSSYNFVNESVRTMKLVLEERIFNLEQLKRKNITSPQILGLFK